MNEKLNEYAKANGLSTIEELEKKLATNNNGMIPANKFFGKSLYEIFCEKMGERKWKN